MNTIPAKNFKTGRGGVPVTLVVLHTTENPCKADVASAVASWFASASAPQASSHYVVGPDETIACVAEENTAWHAPPVNGYSIGVEQTAHAAFTADDWGSDDAVAMLSRSAELVADICSRHGIPAVFVDAEGLTRGDHGITTHAEVTKAFKKSDHTDPGPNFPIASYIDSVASAIHVPTTDPTPAS